MIAINSCQFNTTKKRNPTTDERLSIIAGVSEKTYRMGAKVLKSDNEDIKQRVMSSKTSISAGYKEILKIQKNKNTNNNMPTTKENSEQIFSHSQTNDNSKSKLDYKVDFIENLNIDAAIFFDNLRNYFDLLNNLVTQSELNECVIAVHKAIRTINEIVKQAESNTKLKKDK